MGSACSDSKEEDEGVPIKIPDQFTAYFVAGTVCMPTNISTTSSHPIRFDICRHRCITLGDKSAQAPWTCQGPQCSMLLMATGQAYRVQTETGCDGRELPEPPPGSCTPESFVFNMGAPANSATGEPLTGNVVVSVPFMDMQQAEEISRRVAAGEEPNLVVATVVGQPPPERQWVVNFGPSHPVVTDGYALSGADCHAMSTP